MLNNTIVKVYKAFGLSIDSEIPFTELTLQHQTDFRNADITIKQEELANLNINLTEKEFGFLIQDREVIYKFLDVAVFSIQEGKKILIYPLKEYREDVARSVILGTCMGIILLQRKILPLHGSAFYKEGKVYAIIGDSGVGKSTLASVFLKLGYGLMTDDVIAITFSQSNEPIVIPSYPQQKLWETSLQEFNMDPSNYTSLFKRERKYAVPLTSTFIDYPSPLAGLYELKKGHEKELRIEQVNGLERLSMLYKNTYRNLVIPQLNLLHWHLEVSTRLVQSVEMNRITRPPEPFTAFDIADLILNQIEGGKNDEYKPIVAK